MRDHQRERVLVRGSLVNEMNVQPVDFGDELVEAVERGLTRPPVVFVGPVARQLAGVRQRNALTPVVHAFGLPPSGARQTRPQIIEYVVGNVDPKWLHPFIVPRTMNPTTAAPAAIAPARRSYCSLSIWVA